MYCQETFLEYFYKQLEIELEKNPAEIPKIVTARTRSLADFFTNAKSLLTINGKSDFSEVLLRYYFQKKILNKQKIVEIVKKVHKNLIPN